MKNNIVLIGMPSSGKSTVGKILAEIVGLKFADTDVLIYEREKRPLKDIVNSDGYEKFLDIQEEVILGLNLSGYVIATGGSVIYRERSMNHLRENGIIVYLETDYSEIAERITPDRRLARKESQNLQDMYMERKTLYEKYADININCAARNPCEIADEISRRIAGFENLKHNKDS